MLTSAVLKSPNNEWFQIPKPISKPKIRLFCLPYAGGHAALYFQWPQFIHKEIEVCAIQLPGRATRLAEEPYHRMQPLLDQLSAEMENVIDIPFAFFGHSMGGTLAYELTHCLQNKYNVSPEHLFISGRGAPHLPPIRDNIHHLPDNEFIKEVYGLNGTPAEIMNEPELMELALPILRADFELIETWPYINKGLLNIPITVLGGLDDSNVSLERLKPWAELTENKFDYHTFSGDHFFLHHHQNAIANIINTALI